MDIRRPKKILQKDQNLVAEQNGFRRLAAGLLFSLLIGFAIRGLMHPQKIQSLVAQATGEINKDISVKFESAEVSLSDGAFPRFSVLVKNVNMSSENSCWLRPRIEIDELELPVNLFSLIESRALFSTIKADNVKLILLAEKRDCTVPAKIPQKAKPLAPTQGVSLVEESTVKTTQAPILERISIRRLEVDPVFFPQARTELTGVELSFKSHQPQIIVLKAKSNILKDPQWGEYEAHAQLSVEYSEFPEKNIEAHVFGNWREGSYSFHTSYKLEDGFFQSEAELRHIPLSKLAGVSQHSSLTRFENMKQVWISMKAKAAGHSLQLDQTPVQVDQFKIEGDSGDLVIDRIEWSKISDPFPKPFLIQMKGISLQTVLKINSPTQPSPILNEMGVFTGRAEVENQNNLKVIGEIEGLQFVFANRGQREYQTIKRMSVDLARTQGIWNLNVSRLEPDQGVFNGELSARGDSELKDVTVKLIAEEMSLAPAVQKLMTGGGRLGSFQSRVNLGFKEGVLDRLQGKFFAQNLDVESLKIPKLMAQLSTDVKEGFMAQLSIPEMSVPEKVVVKTFLAPLKDILPMDDEDLFQLKQFHSLLRLRDFKTMKWKPLSFSYDKGSATGQAEWNQDGIISGQLAFKGEGLKKFIIEGTRDKPILRPENERSKLPEVSNN